MTVHIFFKSISLKLNTVMPILLGVVLIDELSDDTGEETNPVVVLVQGDSCPRTFSSVEGTNPFLT